MRRKLNKENIKSLSIGLMIAFVYPLVKSYISINHMGAFSDSCLIIGLIMSLIGVFNSLRLHGDYDITTFITRWTVFKNKNQTFDEYVNNKNKDREGIINYPLYIGIILIIISVITAYIA